MAYHPPEWTTTPRVVKKAAYKGSWTCPDCGKTLAHYWLACPNDGTERPEQS